MYYFLSIPINCKHHF